MELSSYKQVPWTSLDPGTNYSRLKLQGIERIGEKPGLADLIEASGWIAPLVVTKKPKNRFQVDVGFRRFAAIEVLRRRALEAGQRPPWDHVPVEIKDIKTDLGRAKLNIVENLGRLDPSPIEFALAIEGLRSRGLLQNDIGEQLGLSRQMIGHYLAIITLSPEIVDSLKRGTEVPFRELVTWAGMKDSWGKPDHKRQEKAFKTWLGFKSSRGTFTKEVPKERSPRDKAQLLLTKVRYSSTERAKGIREACEYVLGKREEVEI